jgi:hypothetical protein
MKCNCVAFGEQKQKIYKKNVLLGPCPNKLHRKSEINVARH